jgi:hypothetical protein
MRYLKTFESLSEESIILDLKDMALELIDDLGFNVEVYNDPIGDTGNILVKIVHRKNFTMTPSVKDFIFRITDYMKENGYEYDSHSNFGRLHLVEDGRVIISSGEAREKYPSFTMINITFKKD